MAYGVELYLRGGGPTISLERFRFLTSEGGCPRAAVRGRTPGAYLNAHTFVWSGGVRAMVLALLRARIGVADPRSCAHAIAGGDAPCSLEWGRCDPLIHLAGEGGSPASALDYAISARATWVRELFGEAKGGGILAAKIFRRYNSNRKRPGPVLISVDPTLLPPAMIHIFSGDRVSSGAALADTIAALERTFEPATTDRRSCGKPRGGIARIY